jgi:hypothetical protein
LILVKKKKEVGRKLNVKNGIDILGIDLPSEKRLHDFPSHFGNCYGQQILANKLHADLPKNLRKPLLQNIDLTKFIARSSLTLLS